MEKKRKMYANNNRNKEDKKCNGKQTREEEGYWNGLDTKDKVNPYSSTPGQSKTEEKSSLTPEEEKRWMKLEKKADEERANQKQRDRSASKDETNDSLPDNVKSVVRNLRLAVDQMHLGLTKAKELILETARQLDEEHVEEQAKICKKIKEILKDKIQEGKISEGWIEECLPREYKRKYTRTESQQNHLSELVVSTNGNQISQSDIDSKAPDTEAISSLFKRQEDQSPSSGEGSPAAANVNSHPSDKYIGQECSSCLELQDQVTQLKEVLQQISISTADQIQAFGFELIIPKEEHELVKDAMDKSKSAIIVIYDQSKKFVRALADVDN